MSRTKGSGDGSIYQEPSGRWRGQLILPNGKRQSIQGETKGEVKRKIAEYHREVQAGLHGTLEGRQTFQQFAEVYLKGEKHLMRTTFRGYQSIFRCHMDSIGQIPLTELRPRDLQAHYTRKLGTLASSTVNHMHEFFHVVLERAVRLDIIPRNPADSVDAPPLKPKEYQALSEEQTMAMLHMVQADRYAALYILAATTGMRESELLGLTWEQVSFHQGKVRVAKSVKRIGGIYVYENLKSRSSRRDLPLAPRAEEALRAWQAQQEADRQLVGEAWGNAWNLVFTNSVGAPVHPTHALKRFQRLMKGAGLPPIRLHDLRHTYATMLIEAGVPIKVVSELLGHSSIEITLRVYGHVTPKMRDQAISTITHLFPAPDRVIDAPEINLHG